MRLWHIINGLLIPKLIMGNEVSVRRNNWLDHKRENIVPFIYLTESRLKYTQQMYYQIVIQL